MALSKRDLGLAAELSEQIDTVVLDQPVTPLLLDVVQAAIAPSMPHVYSTRWRDKTFEAIWCEVRNANSTGLRPRYETAFNTRFTELFYDPRRVEVRQRNRALLLDELSLGHKGHEFLTGFWKTAHAAVEDQVRVLVTDGSELLAWVGGFAPVRNGFGARDKAMLEALVPALRRRLIFERDRSEAELVSTSLEAVLDALPAPALLLDAKLRPVLRSRAASSDSQRHSRIARRIPVRAKGFGPHFIAILESEDPPSLSNWIRRYDLTPVEGRVLALLVLGRANRAISIAHQCSERTVEAHVTSILLKTGCDTKAELAARCWREQN